MQPVKNVTAKTQAGNNSNIVIEQVVAIFDKMLQYKCITPTQRKQIIRNFILN